MIQTVSAYGADNSFNERILPRRARRSNDLLDTQTFDPSPNLLTIDRIPIAQHVARSGIVWKRLYQLLSSPLCSRVLGYIEVHNPPAVMAEHDKHIKNAKCSSRNGEEINPSYTNQSQLYKLLHRLNTVPNVFEARRLRGKA